MKSLNTNKQFSLMLMLMLMALLVPITSTADTGSSTTKEIRIVSVGGGLTEILYELGLGKQIVGVDTTSKWPEAATKKAQVGYHRRLSAEGILSLKPTALMVTQDAGPKEVLEQIKSAGIPINVFVTEESVEGVANNIRLVAKTVNKTKEGEVLVSKINNDYQQLKETVATHSSKPSVAFFLGMGKGSPMAAGSNTGAAKMIELAGGNNAFANIESYKQISTESMIVAAPEVILIAAHVAKGKKIDEILKLKSIKLTPAAKNKRVFIVDTLLMLGYGPRIVEAIDTLASQIHINDKLTKDSSSSSSNNNSNSKSKNLSSSFSNKVSVN